MQTSWLRELNIAWHFYTRISRDSIACPKQKEKTLPVWDYRPGAKNFMGT
jgi:hypothetical protein